MKSGRSLYEVEAEFVRCLPEVRKSLTHFPSIQRLSHVSKCIGLKLARSSYEIASNFIRSCPKLCTKIDQVSFRTLCKACPKFAQSWPKVRTKLARSSCKVGLKLVHSWPEVHVKLARSSHEVL